MHLKKLDALRGFAAVYVALGHWFDQNEKTPQLLKDLFRFGQQSVILFFLLSGFVIFIATKNPRKMAFREYFMKRFRRIYPVMIFGFVLSSIICYIDGSFHENFKLDVLFGNLFMLQDYGTEKPGLWFTYFMRNSPLWSLSYEWWFYMLFFVFYLYLLDKPYRLLVSTLISAVAAVTYILFPNHASLVLAYFIIWWSGYEAAAVYFKEQTFTIRNMYRIIGANAVVFFIFASYNYYFKYALEAHGIESILVKKPLIHFSTTLLFLIAGLIWWRFKLIGFNQTIGWFVYIAPISYAIYVIHFPILKIWNLYKYFDYQETFPNMIIINGIRIVVLLGLSWLLEIKIQPIINKYIK